MKSLGFKTILLGLVMLLLLVSVSAIGWTIFQMTKSAAADVKTFWTGQKYFLITPTVTNVVAMALLAVLLISG